MIRTSRQCDNLRSAGACPGRPLLPLLAAVAVLATLAASPATAETIETTLNGLRIRVDGATGSIVSLSSVNTGTLLEAPPDAAGLLDLAYPTETFAPMRLASRFSKAQVTRGPNELTIEWRALGASRPNLPLPAGAVLARVTIRAADDMRSVILSAHIENESGAPVPQILFPDLWGLKPFAGAEDTHLRLARKTLRPFAEPLGDPLASPWYAINETSTHLSSSPIVWKEYPAGGYYNDNSLRWLDYGSWNGGLSVFQKKWGTYDWPNVMTHRTERDPMSLRLVWEHRQTIAPHRSWDSGEFWLTPHAGGWAKGIETYRSYVRSVNPPRTLPDHVRDDIGFQTIWMIQTAESDPRKAVFRFADLPKVASDERRYGMHELVPWGWNTYSVLPIPVRPELGTTDDLLRAVRESAQLGVNIAPFISVTIIHNSHASRYGVKPANDDFSYSDELIPMFRPYYTKFWNGVEVDSNNAQWRKDVKDALVQWIDRGLASFSWDVFMVHPGPAGQRPPLLNLVDDVRKHARARNPQSTFSGESVKHLELESQVLDYLWNWTDYEDSAPITSVLSAPRLDCDIEKSALVVAKCFADNLYINAMPRQLDAPNGTALISDRPELGAALIHAAQLRKQFLPYFTTGTLIGDSIQSAATNAFVRAYQMPDRLLVIVLNDREKAAPVVVRSNLSLWLPSAASYKVQSYDGDGKPTGESTAATPQRWSVSTAELKPGEMAFFEISAASQAARSP
jgi:hypothetical protein